MDNTKINVLEIIAAFAILVPAALLLYQYTARYILNYRIEDSGVEIVLFGMIPIKRIPFNNIVEIKKLSCKETYTETLLFKDVEMFLALRFGNRVWGESVLIRQKKRLFKVILITPDNANQFVQEVSRRLKGTQTAQTSIKI